MRKTERRPQTWPMSLLPAQHHDHKKYFKNCFLLKNVDAKNQFLFRKSLFFNAMHWSFLWVSVHTRCFTPVALSAQVRSIFTAAHAHAGLSPVNLWCFSLDSFLVSCFLFVLVNNFTGFSSLIQFITFLNYLIIIRTCVEELRSLIISLVQ